MQLAYFVILHDGRTADLNLINPRLLVEGDTNRFVYDGPNPGYWGTEIKRRHGLRSQYEVMWELGRRPMIPSEAALNDPDDRPSVCFSGS